MIQNITGVHKRLWFQLFIPLLVVSLLSGCQSEMVTAIPDSAVEVTEGDSLKDYATIICDGQEFAVYGTLADSTRPFDKIITECIGYHTWDNSIRYYSLKDVDNRNYIGEYDLNAEMAIFTILRSIDTIGKEIDTPDYIHSNEYDDDKVLTLV